MKWSEKSCKKFHVAASKPDVLARAIVECCAASSAGRDFCHGTYWLEGDGFMAVAAFKILDDLRQTLDDGIILEGLEVAAGEAALIMAPVRIAQELLATTARDEYTRALEVEVSTKAAGATLVVDTPATIGRGGTRPAKTNRATATAQLSGRAADTAAGGYSCYRGTTQGHA
jgi:hypothetical protein